MSIVGFLDRLSPGVRHFLLILVGAVVTEVIANQTQILSELPPAVVPLVAAILGIIATTVTPFTQQYGVGSADTTVTIDSGDLEA